MNLIKKIMTVMAAAGTVGITALFLVYPARDALRQWYRSEISLEEENVPQSEGASETSEEENREGIGQGGSPQDSDHTQAVPDDIRQEPGYRIA